MKRTTRVRWTADERAAVVRRAQTLLAEDPGIAVSALFARSQDSLPAERRRRGGAGVHAWLRAEVKRAGPLPSPATTWRAEPRPAADAAPVASAEDAANAKPKADEHLPSAADVRSPLVSSLIEAGVQVVAGILGDTRVRTALLGLLRVASSPPTEADERVGAVKEEAPGHAGGDLVVVAGCSPEEAQALKKELGGALEVTFWSPDEPRDRLMEVLPQAGLVIGVASGLPPTVESSLARLGSRYVRHTAGMPALYRRLAEHALT